MSRIIGVHEVGGEAFWREFREVMGGEGTLMTYRYLGTWAQIDQPKLRASGSMAVRSDMRGPTGLQAAPLIILVADVIGVLADAIAVPAPAQMTLDLLDRGDGVRRVGCRGEMVHAGRKQLFGKAVIFDADDESRLLAVFRDADAVMAPAPDGYQRVETGEGPPDNGALPPLWQAFGGEQRGAEFAIAQLTPEIGSTSASLHHGVTHILLEAAAQAAQQAGASGKPARLAHWHVTFTARGKTGPFVTRTRTIGKSAGRQALDIDLFDEGEGRLIASATAIYAED
jgi:acyl-coenzyme A thioesterase PaaI-like protein